MSEVTRTREFRITSIAIVLMVISGLMWVVPPADVEVENSLHHLNFIPVLLSAVLLGWRGAALTTLATAVEASPPDAREGERSGAGDRVEYRSAAWGQPRG